MFLHRKMYVCRKCKCGAFTKKTTIFKYINLPLSPKNIRDRRCGLKIETDLFFFGVKCNMMNIKARENLKQKNKKD